MAALELAARELLRLKKGVKIKDARCHWWGTLGFNAGSILQQRIYILGATLASELNGDAVVCVTAHK